MEEIKDLAQLRKIIGEPMPVTKHKIHKRLTTQAQEFIRRSPMIMLATASKNGEPSVSPKGDEPGFVHIVDDQTLLIPERSGNKLIFGFQNLLDNPNVGILFMLPGTGETLRVRGTARMLADEALCKKLTGNGKPALMATEVKITEAYFHCAKAFLRSYLWNPEHWPQPLKVSFGEEISCNTEFSRDDIQKLDQRIDERYKDRSLL